MPLVSQNPQASGGGGGGSGVQVATVTVSSAEILELHTTPITLVSGATAKVVVVTEFVVAYLAGATPYTDNGGFIVVDYDPPPQDNAGFVAGAGFWDQATDKTFIQAFNNTSGIAPSSAVGADIIIWDDTANPTLGNGTLKVTVSYFLAPAS